MNILQNKSKLLVFSCFFITLLFLINCSSGDDSSNRNQSNPNISTMGSFIAFTPTDVLSYSASQSIQVSGSDLADNISVTVSENFQVSLDNTNFSNQISINIDEANAGGVSIYVRFAPGEFAVGIINGTLSLQSSQASTISLALSGTGVSITPTVSVNVSTVNFDDTSVGNVSESVELTLTGSNLTTGIDLFVNGDFEISFDDISFTNSLNIPAANANGETNFYVRFLPTTIENHMGTLNILNDEAADVEVNLSGIGIPVIHNYVTFNNERLAFGGGYNQSSTQTFNLHDDISNIESIKMYVKLRCPSVGCDEWDVYANVKVLDPASGELFELGRYITPYWNDNSQLERGWEFDVTDFKSLLTGATELRIRTECWNDRGYEITVDFDYIEGEPDYPYYAVSRVLAYDEWSTSGVPYGVSHTFDLDKSVSIPANTESTHLRTIISGWGHATPNDPDGRGCAEWCYRTHDILINGVTQFQHSLEPLGCASNPVSNQSPGNWTANRAGWCPGMEVPTRINEFATSMAGTTFSFEYDYEDWVSDGGNGNAYYATSTFVVVKSNTPITNPIVVD
jgi:hypothetical protein